MPSQSTTRNGSLTRYRKSYPYSGDWVRDDTWIDKAYYDDLSKSPITESYFDPSGFRLPTAYSLERSTNEYWSGTFSYVVKSSYREDMIRFDGNLVVVGVSPLSPIESLPGLNQVSRCEVKTLLRVKDQKVHWGAMFAEATGAVLTVGSSIERLALAYRSVKKGDIKNAAKHLGVSMPDPKKLGKGASSDWLAMQYGWLPLMSDIYGTYEEIRRKTEFRPIRFTTRAVVSEKIDRSEKPSTAGLDSYGAKAFVRVHGRRLVKVSLTYDFVNSTLQNLSRTGMLNPAEIAWELVPFSFVVDWAIPVGDWISALTADSGLSFVAGSRTLFVKAEKSGFMLGGDTQYFTSTAEGITSSTSYVKMDRQIYDSSPIPLPYYKNPLSTGHALNAMALLRSIF